MTQEVVEAVAVTVEEKITEVAKEEEPEVAKEKEPEVSYADSSADLDVVEGEILAEDPEERTS